MKCRLLRDSVRDQNVGRRPLPQRPLLFREAAAIAQRALYQNICSCKYVPNK